MATARGSASRVTTPDPVKTASAKAEAENADSAVADQVQNAVDKETEQGFRGVEVDPTPNENYTLAGQNAGLPVPETDEDAAEQARLAQVAVAREATGVAER
jgi:hypothetical protein